MPRNRNSKARRARVLPIYLHVLSRTTEVSIEVIVESIPVTASSISNTSTSTTTTTTTSATTATSTASLSHDDLDFDGILLHGDEFVF